MADPERPRMDSSSLPTSDSPEAIAGSVTILLQQIRRGEQDAIQPLFELYFGRLAALGRALLPERFQRVADGEDLALEVLTAFFEAAGSGTLPELQTRGDVWRMLARRLQQRAANEIRRHSTQKAGDGRVRGESVFIASSENAQSGGLDQARDHRMDALLHELHCDLVERLDNALLQDVARLLLEGHSVDDIAAMLDRSRATIYRKLELIRAAWLVE
jgi:DNA-directed RNA polymerase specialized sigma24 family protein